MRDVDRSPRFEDVDWNDVSGFRRFRWIELLVLLGGLVVLAALFLYETHVAHVYLVSDWRVTRVDWVVLAGAVILAAFVGVPAIRNRDVTRRAFRHLLSRPSTAAATALLAAVVVLGVVGPAVLGSSELRFDRTFHPPLGATVPSAAVGSCEGALSPIEDSIYQHCHGTLSAYPFGANGHGIPMEYLVADGARTALYVVVFTAAFVVPLAAAVGVVAGFRGGLIDDLLMAYVDVQLSIPAIIVYVIGYMYWNPSLLLLLVTFGLLSWGGIARLVRSEVLQRREAGYVMVARSLGASRGYVARRHVLPNITNTLVPAVFQLFALLILVEAGVAFLGFQEVYTYSWGLTIAEGVDPGEMPPVDLHGRPLGPHDVWWVATFPAIALSLTLVAFKLVGDGLRDALDPRGQH